MARGRSRSGKNTGRGRRRQRSGGAKPAASQAPNANEPESDSDAVDVDFEDVSESGVAVQDRTLARSTGGLGDLYQPSPLALLSDEEFEKRLETLALENERIDRIKRTHLTEDTEGDGSSGDYGVIPGTKKKSLYQSGAEKFLRLFSYRPVYRRTRFGGDGVTAPHFRYAVDCDLIDNAGDLAGTGGGSASSWEVKYRYRNAGLQCPECGATEIRVSKFAESPGFYCWKKPDQGHDGCGAQFGEDDQRITTQTAGRVENPDPYDSENTIQQMADKRALVKATRTTFALSNTFTQEDGGGGDTAPASRPAARGGKGDRSKAGAQPISEGQLGTIRERIAERSKALKDSGITAEEIERELCTTHKLEKLGDLPQVQIAEVIKAVHVWEPPGGEEG